jgi:hypothetical protein
LQQQQGETMIQRHEAASALWVKLREHYLSRLDLYRTKLEGSLTHEETLVLRGRIKEIRSLLALEQSESNAPVDD